MSWDKFLILENQFKLRNKVPLYDFLQIFVYLKETERQNFAVLAKID